MALLISCAVCVPAAADSVMYKYQDEDGTVWFTDHPAKAEDFHNRQFLGFHGREPATASCRGVTPEIMEARARRYEYDIERFAAHHAIPAAMILAIISVESCFDELAVSRAGAEGLMQLMPETAELLAVENSFDPTANIRGGIAYFSEMRRRFDFNDRLALAAYNAGPGAVDRFGGIPPFPETRKYVTRVLDRYKFYFRRNQNAARSAPR